MEDDTDSMASSGPRAATRLFDILELLGSGEGPRTLSTIAREIGAPKSSALNLLRSLVSQGYVEHEDGTYGLGLKSFHLAAVILNQRHFPEVVLPIIRKLADDVGETVMIAKPCEDGENFVYIAKMESRNVLRFAAQIGDRRALFASSAGLVLLAGQSEQAVEEYLAKAPLTKFTDETVVDKKIIRQRIAFARANGYVCTGGGVSVGVSSVSAPIRSRQGVIASIIVGAPSHRLIGEREEQVIQSTLAAARAASEVMS